MRKIYAPIRLNNENNKKSGLDKRQGRRPRGGLEGEEFLSGDARERLGNNE